MVVGPDGDNPAFRGYEAVVPLVEEKVMLMGMQQDRQHARATLSTQSQKAWSRVVAAR